MNIAIFDSGIGGITFLREAYKKLPYENYIYYADTENVPYGIKPREIVKQYIFQAVDFLSRQDLKILVIACNTATSAAINDLRQKYSFPILGMEPAVKPAVEKTTGKRILILTTTLTMNEEKLKNLITNIDKDHQVDIIPMDRLVTYAEQFRFDDNEIKKYIKTSLDIINTGNYGTIVLGCTHFIYYKTIIQSLLPKEIEVIDGNKGTLNNMLNIMKNKGLMSKTNDGSITFFSSGKPDNKDRIMNLKRLMGS
jgi:glutamate racemase